LTIYYNCVNINTIVQPHKRSQVSRLGTESFILMEFLIATILSCESAEDIISRIPHSNESRVELVQQVKLSAEEGCFEDAKAD